MENKDFIKKQSSELLKRILYSDSYDWCYSLKKWISQIDSEYILLLLDDHIIRKFESKHIEILLTNLKRKI